MHGARREKPRKQQFQQYQDSRDKKTPGPFDSYNDSEDYSPLMVASSSTAVENSKGSSLALQGMIAIPYNKTSTNLVQVFNKVSLDEVNSTWNNGKGFNYH